MAIKKKWDQIIVEWLPVGVLIYCISQPIIDVIAYWLDHYDRSSVPTMLARMLLLAGSVGLGFLLSDRKKIYWIFLAVLSALTGMHVVANWPYQLPMYDLTNLFRIYLLPLTTVSFVTFLRRGGVRVFRALKTGLLVNFFIILAVESISVLTGTDRKTYIRDQIGVFGWFLGGNSQSAVLSILAPLTICWSVNRWRGRIVPVALFTIAAEAVLFFLGPRLTFAAMAASGFGISVCLLLVDRSYLRQSVTILLIATAFTAAFPLSPTAKRLRAVESNEVVKQQLILEMQTDPAEMTEVTTEPEDTGDSDQEARADADKKAKKKLRKMKRVYRRYFSTMVKRFGIDRVMEIYDQSLEARILGNTRLKKINYCTLEMEDSPVLCRFFGMNLDNLRVFVPNGIFNEKTGQWEDGYEIYDVENDFHGIYFLLGWTGLVLMVGFLLWFGIRCLDRVLKDRKTYFTVDFIGFAGAYCYAMVHAYFTVSVLRVTSASVYFAFVLAGSWYLSAQGTSELVDKREEA